MKNFLRTTLVAGALASAALGPATAEGAGSTTLGTIVTKLASTGHSVVVHRVGTFLMHRCTISQVRPGQTNSRTDSRAPGAGDDLVTTMTNKSVYVDVIS